MANRSLVTMQFSLTTMASAFQEVAGEQDISTPMRLTAPTRSPVFRRDKRKPTVEDIQAMSRGGPSDERFPEVPPALV